MGTVRMVGQDFCPVEFIRADGAILNITSYPALFSLLGCEFGGNCTSTFAVPDFRGRAPVGLGVLHNPPVAQSYLQGLPVGSETVVMTQGQLPVHRHDLMASTGGPSVGSPLGAGIATFGSGSAPAYVAGPVALSEQMAAGVVGEAGSSHAIPVRMSYQTVNFCIAVNGYYPPRN
jgi:microcystin-dependent protein